MANNKNKTKPVNIYCLVDPINDIPFYIGVTNCKISVRLSGHISESIERLVYIKGREGEYCNNSLKCIYIRNILNKKLRPKIILLQTVHINSVNQYERFYYDMFINQGYTMHQTQQFTYTEQTCNSNPKIVNTINNNLTNNSLMVINNVIS